MRAAARAGRRAAPADEASEPPPPTAAADRVRAAIYAAVLDHRLRPGARLREEELADTFAVSRTVVRQALHGLARDGIVLLRPNRGAIVPAPTRGDGAHVFDARRVVEGEVARRLAGRLTPEQRAALERIVDAEDGATRAAHREEAIRLSGEFHLQLARFGGNPLFVRLLEELLPTTSLLIALYKAPGAPMCVAHGHRKLLAALAEGSRGVAATEMRRHLDEIERSVAAGAGRSARALGDVFGAYREAPEATVRGGEVDATTINPSSTS